MKINELIKNGDTVEMVTREMTEEEIAELPEVDEEAEVTAPTNALTEMITEMSKATTLAQMRNAAKAFLDKTE